MARLGAGREFSRRPLRGSVSALILVVALVATLSLTCFTSRVNGKELGVLGVSWMSRVDPVTGTPVSYLEGNLHSLNAIWPLAILHFNERRSDVVPAFGQLGNCSVRLNLLELVDDQGSATTAMKELFSNYGGVHAILGPIRSSIATSLGVTSSALNVPMISHWATSSELADNAVYPYFSRTVASDSAMALSMVSLFSAVGYTQVGMLYVGDAFGAGWEQLLFASCDRAGIRLKSVAYPDLRGGAELGEAVANAMEILARDKLNVIVVVYGLVTETLGHIALAAEKHKMLGPEKLFVTILNNVTGADPYFPDDLPVIRQFLRGSLQVLDSLPGLEADVPNPLFDAFKQAYATSDPADVNPFLPNETIANRSFQLTPNYFRESVNQAYGPWAWAYDAVALLGIAACRLGEDVPVTDGGALLRSIRDTTFSGPSGLVKLLPNGDRDPLTNLYVLNSLHLGSDNMTIIPRKIGLRRPNSANWTLNLTNAVFRDGTNRFPRDVIVPTEDFNHLPRGILILGWIETALLIFLSIAAASWMFYNRASKVVVASQPFFMYMIALGSAVLGAAIIPLTIEDSSTACMAFPWLYVYGVTLCLAPIAAKSWRVVQLWSNPGFKRTKARGKNYLALVLLVIVLETALLLGWTLTSPLIHVRFVSANDTNSFPLSSYGVCTLEDWGTWVFLGILLTILAVLIVVTVAVSIYVRNAPVQFHEARWTAIAAVSLAQVYFLGVVLVAATYSIPVAKFLVLSSLCLLTGLAILFSMFVPKIWMVGAESSTAGKEDASAFHTPASGPTGGASNAKKPNPAGSGPKAGLAANNHNDSGKPAMKPSSPDLKLTPMTPGAPLTSGKSSSPKTVSRHSAQRHDVEEVDEDLLLFRVADDGEGEYVDQDGTIYRDADAASVRAPAGFRTPSRDKFFEDTGAAINPADSRGSNAAVAGAPVEFTVANV